MTTHIIETVTFKLAEGADSAAFVDAAHAIAPFLEKRDGFIRRRLSCTDNGDWIEHIEWTSLDDAKSAAEAIGAAPEAQAFLRMIDGPSVALSHSAVRVALG